jgi:hypothetical protein
MSLVGYLCQESVWIGGLVSNFNYAVYEVMSGILEFKNYGDGPQFLVESDMGECHWSEFKTEEVDQCPFMYLEKV